MINRRQFLGRMAATIGLGCIPAFADDSIGLNGLAQMKGLFFGSVAREPVLWRDPTYRQLIVRECGMIVGEAETKWEMLRKMGDRIDFAPADSLLGFAERNNLAMRGHTLIWHSANPKWLEEKLANATRDEAIGIMRDHIFIIMGHFRGKLSSWDVVNEAVDPKAGLPHGLRPSPWLKAIGEDYIELAFGFAQEADPSTPLVYNDYDIEYEGDYFSDRRSALLRLLERLRAKRVPCNAVGLQTHLNVGQRFSESVYSNFLNEIANLGFDILLTELDVNDKIRGTIPERDTIIADATQRVLDVAFDQRRVKGLLTWGITDRYSWLTQPLPIKSLITGFVPRPLPFDEDFRPKPLWYAMARAFQGAPIR
jgi:endo-1,4-beta-xylanase